MMNNKKVEKRIKGTLNSVKPDRKVLDSALHEMDNTSTKVTKQYNKKWKMVTAVFSICFVLLVSIVPIGYHFSKDGEYIVGTTLVSKPITSIQNYYNENAEKLKGELLYYDYEIHESLLFQDKNRDVYISEKYQIQESNIFLNVLLETQYLYVFDDLKIDEVVIKSIIIGNVVVKYQYDIIERQFSAEFTYREYEYLLNINGIDEKMAIEYVCILIK